MMDHPPNVRIQEAETNLGLKCSDYVIAKFQV